MTFDSGGVSVRRRPSQVRSAATFDSLLSAAAALLEATGAAAFNTNALAAESGISVRAIYRYFPNKQAIFVELARRLSADWLECVSTVGDLGDPASAWEPIWCGYLDAWVRGVVGTSGGRAVIAAMRDDPELRSIDDEINERYVEGISVALRQRRPALTAAHADVAARVLMRSTIGVLDEAVQVDEAHRSLLIGELQTMHVHYLRHLLGEEQIDVRR